MTNEKQKKVTDIYRNNWDEIFDKNLNKEQDQKSIEVEVSIENDSEEVTVKKNWYF